LDYEKVELHLLNHNDVKKSLELIEAGFEYVTGEYHDGGKFFKKRKLSYLRTSHFG
jgi:hypothetical protein